ncbi:hypothetical protein FE257_007741 [Aspergillus nanangensis]|uniref:Transcriptional regulatory protein DEP1 n=1 Tax=Aspergillus nanangensis TaxID=2582783 RepID=A0AAD4GXV7_ASPNN|nr:hypothetical protein FE257_007741 [Aspergillus nanangensis]
MEVAGSREATSVGPSTEIDSTVSHGGQNLLLDHDLIDDDDGRSSSLSEIDDMPSDYESPKAEKLGPDNDSEAETERIEDSPNRFRPGPTNIVVSSTGLNPSPSKLAQSTTYNDIDDEEDHMPDDSPSKPRPKNERLGETADETPGLDDSTLSDGLGKKRKRLGSGDYAGTEIDEEDEPPQKRRGSVKSDLSDPPAEDIALTPEPMEEELPKTNEEDTPADDIPESDLPAPSVKGRKTKRSRRRARRTRDADEDADGAVDTGAEGGLDDHAGDEDAAERDEVEDGEAAAKHEEESAKRASAMDSLAVLEREFATLRDKIYDERISKLNRELDMLNGPNPTHPEYLQNVEVIKQYRDAKTTYEHTLFQYRVEALMNKSLAERAQSHSTYFQRVRDIRERHSSSISKQFYAIQHDRFKTDELSPQHYIPFPTRRSQQIAQQTAYNQEVSILAGVAKYVGFPAAPSLAAARSSELDEDLEKMGITVETRVPVSQPQTATLPRQAMPAMSTFHNTAAEEAFLQQTPWANPLHPIHQQQQPQPQPQPQSQRPPAFTTPAAQKRVVDVNAPNGSASTIAENSSANNTPYGADEQPPPGPFTNPDYEVDRRSGFRSLSSSPLDMRKPQPISSYPGIDHRSPPHDPRNTAAFSPSSGRLGLFHSSSNAKRESPPPPLSSKPSIHQHSSALLSGSGSNQMVAR